MKVYLVKKTGYQDKDVSHKILGYVYKRETGKEFSEDLIVKGIQGKPYIENFMFSISHSSNYMAVAVSNSEVGVDLEEMRVVPLILKRHLYNKDEYDKYPDILDLWVFKEAYSKYLGLGVTLDYTNILRDKVEKKVTFKNLSTDKYYMYVIGNEEFSELINLDIKDIMED